MERVEIEPRSLSQIAHFAYKPALNHSPRAHIRPIASTTSKPPPIRPSAPPATLTLEAHMQNRKSKLLQLVHERLTETETAKRTQSRRTAPTKTQSNRQNATHSTGPKTDEGKAKVSANALKTGFFAHVERLNPHDSPAYQDAVDDLRLGLNPDGPVEEQLIRELAMLRARLMRLEAAEYALICSGIEQDPGDAREVAAAYLNNAAALAHLQKAEVHLRRAYNRTWDRLERMQKERHKLPLDQALKQSQVWLKYYSQKGNGDLAERTGPGETASNLSSVVRDKGVGAIRTNRPELIPQRHPAIDEKGNLIKLQPGDPMCRSKDDGFDVNTNDSSGDAC